jgi:hypothetical protein
MAIWGRRFIGWGRDISQMMGEQAISAKPVLLPLNAHSEHQKVGLVAGPLANHFLAIIEGETGNALLR